MTISAYPKYESYKDSGVDWIGEVPAHWDVKRGKFLFKEVNERSDSGDEELLSVSHTTGVTSRSEKNVSMFMAEDYTGSKLCTRGDVVINTMWAWMGALGVSRQTGIVSPSYGVYRSITKGDFNQQFLEWLLRATPFIEQYNKISTGLHSSRLRLYPHMFLGMFMAFPKRYEQDAITAFLETKCGKIDEAVRIKEEQIALLKERRQILIQQAVTRGLNPDAPMKDSGIDWIGEIPAHWEVRRSKFLFTQSKELALKDDIQLSATQSYGVIPQEQFEELVGRRVVKISTNLEKRKHVELDDFVISMRSFQGGLERAYATGCIRSSYVILRPSPEVNPEFFGFLLKTPRYIHALQITGNFIRDGQDLTFENFADVDLYVPPYEEQAAIARYIRQGCESIDNAISLKESQIAALKEYKTSLINAAVTGKIKVS